MQTKQPIAHKGHLHTGESMSASLGMKVMAVMMAMCVGGTALAATVPFVPIGAGVAVAVPIAVGFGWVTLTRPAIMAPLMGVCCGFAVLVNATADLGVVPALALAGLVAVAVAAVSQRLMGHVH